MELTFHSFDVCCDPGGGNDVTFMFELSVGWVGRGKGLAYAHSGVIVEQDVSLR